MQTTRRVNTESHDDVNEKRQYNETPGLAASEILLWNKLSEGDNRSLDTDNVFKVALEKSGKQYEYVTRLGGGEFSNVYLVRNTVSGKEHALKILDYHYLLQKLKKENPAESKSKFDDIKKRFITEARLFEKIDHPNIVKIYDTGVFTDEIDDIEIPYFLMDYIKGCSLSNVIKNEAPMNVDKVLKIAQNVLDALRVIHKKHIIHRDLKPANIMIEEDSGQAILIDFGIAKNILGSTRLTTTGTLLGSPTYMAPEQFADSSKVGPGIDIYSFSAVLFEMLTGTPPFTGNTFLELMNAHRRKPIPSASMVNPSSGILRSIDVAMTRAMAKDPNKRYKSAEEFWKALKAAHEGKVLGSSKKYPLFFLAAVLLLAGIFIMTDPLDLFHDSTETDNKQNVINRTVEVGKQPVKTDQPPTGGIAADKNGSELPPSGEEEKATPDPEAIKNEKYQKCIKAVHKYLRQDDFSNATSSLNDAQKIKDTDEIKTLTETIAKKQKEKIEFEKKNGSEDFRLLSEKTIDLADYLAFKTKYPESIHIPALNKKLKADDPALPPEIYWNRGKPGASVPIKKNAQGYYELEFDEHNGHYMIYVPGKKFWIDKYEVSVAQYNRFEGITGKVNKPSPKNSNYIPSKKGYPKVVFYEHALEYCNYYGFRLPKEDEWEYIAGKGKNIYPWGDEEPDHNGEFRANYDSMGNEKERDGYVGTAPVRSFEKYPSPFGVVNMAGNVWEWVEGRILKGGGVISEKDDLKINNRIRGQHHSKNGFRCVMDEPGDEPVHHQAAEGN